MMCLLLLISLLCNVNSFKQIAVDYEKCKSEYFCLVNPEAALQKSNDDLLVRVMKTTTLNSKLPDVGILIKPLSQRRWLLILRSDIQIVNKDGLKLVKVAKDLTIDEAEQKANQVIASCAIASENELITPFAKLPFKFELRQSDSWFNMKTNQLQCAGILTSDDGNYNIARSLNAYQSSGTDSLRLIYYVRATGAKKHFVRTLLKNSPEQEIIDFQDITKMNRCPFDILKTPDAELLYTHYLREVDTFSDSIECTKNLIKTSTSAHDLMIKPAGTDKLLIIDKITCENNQLFYHPKNSAGVLINGEPIVACGERVKCKLPEKVNSDRCTDPTLEIINGQCNDGNDKCEKIKCPNNEWIINDEKKKITGEMVCRKESIEDESGTFWYTKRGDDLVKVIKGSCPTKSPRKRVSCLSQNPIRSTCDGVSDEKCFPATFVTDKIYCPPHFDMAYKDGGKDKYIDKLICDTRTHNWNSNGIVMNKAKIVYCLYNATRDRMMLEAAAAAAAAAAANGEDDEDEYDIYEMYLYYGIAALIACNILAWAIYKLEECYRVRLWHKENQRILDRQKDPTKCNLKDRYFLRPENKREIDLAYQDLRRMGPRTVNVGLWKEFHLYSPVERVKYLETLFVAFDMNVWFVKMSIPLLYSCTSDHSAGNEKQPLHPKVLKKAFRTLKVICSIYEKKGNKDAETRIKVCIGVRANCILLPMGLERAADEDTDYTVVRNMAIEALLFSDHKETEDRLLKIWEEKEDKGNISTPLRKFVWAVAVRRNKQNQLIRDMFQKEVDLRTKGEPNVDDETWGDKISHFIYALCAEEQREAVDNFFNHIIKESFFNKDQVLSGFHAMLEVFPHNQLSARYLLMARHKFIREKLPPTEKDYLKLWRKIYSYTALWPGKPHWITNFVGNIIYHEPDERDKLDINKVYHMVTIYKAVGEYRGVVECMERHLKNVDFVKEEELTEGGKKKKRTWVPPEDHNNHSSRRFKRYDPYEVKKAPPPSEGFHEEDGSKKKKEQEGEEEVKKAEENDEENKNLQNVLKAFHEKEKEKASMKTARERADEGTTAAAPEAMQEHTAEGDVEVKSEGKQEKSAGHTEKTQQNSQ